MASCDPWKNMAVGWLVENYILDLQSIPRESNNKDVAAMLVELTIEANEESFVIVHQHGGNDVNCKSRIVKNNKRKKHLLELYARGGVMLIGRSRRASWHFCHCRIISLSSHRKNQLIVWVGRRREVSRKLV